MSSPREPKRIYPKGDLGTFLARTGRAVGSAGGMVFKEVTKPGRSPREVMAPFGKLYRQFGPRVSQPATKVARWFSVAKLPKQERETLVQRTKNLAPGVIESASKRDVVEEELDPMEAQIAKGIGAYSAQRIMKNVRALFRAGSGMHVKKEKVAEIIRNTTGVDKARIERSVAVAESFAPPSGWGRNEELSQPKVAEELAEAQELGILSGQQVEAAEKPLRPEYFPKTQAPFHERHRQQPESLMSTFAKRFGGSRGSQNTKDNK